MIKKNSSLAVVDLCIVIFAYFVDFIFPFKLPTSSALHPFSAHAFFLPFLRTVTHLECEIQGYLVNPVYFHANTAIYNSNS